MNTTGAIHHTTRRVWRAAQASLTQEEQARVMAEVEETGATFDDVLLAHLRRGMAAARFCAACGHKLA